MKQKFNYCLYQYRLDANFSTLVFQLWSVSKKKQKFQSKFQKSFKCPEKHCKNQKISNKEFDQQNPTGLHVITAEATNIVESK